MGLPRTPLVTGETSPADWSARVPFPFTRESSIRIDEHGCFHHDGARVEHPGLARAMAGWITRHPEGGRYVLQNGYDWCYVVVDDAPFVATSARVEGAQLVVTLQDGSEVALHEIVTDPAGMVRGQIRRDEQDFPVRLSRHASLSLEPRLSEERGSIMLSLDEGPKLRLGPADP